MSNDNLLYYSTNTYLAFWLAENFYNSEHFVWCSPVFDPSALNKYDIRRSIPPSSSPLQIYLTLSDDVERADMHSSKIIENRNGLKRGAAIQHSKGVIDANDFARIMNIIDTAPITHFRPLVYIIPRSLVDQRVQRVAVDAAANPLSIEYQIVDLKKHEYDIIELKKR